MIHKTPLEAKVAAVNKANGYAVKVYGLLKPIFEPLVGEKILKADGTLLAKFEKLLPEFVDGVPLRVYKDSSDYYLAWVVKTCETHESRHLDCQIAMYHETTVYIGDLRHGILIDLADPPVLRTDYCVDEVLRLRQAYKVARQAASDALSALHPFGEN